MRKRTDAIDKLLEHWAGWRITGELYEGTGPCTLVRFCEPAGTAMVGSRPLFQGNITRRLSALNADLGIHLGASQLNNLIALYGFPGEDSYKAHYLGITVSSLSTTRRRARIIALQHITPSLINIAGEHHDQLRTEAAG